MLLRNPWYRFILAIAQALALVFFKFRTLGQRNVPVSGGAIIAANHQSYLDPGLLAIGLTRPINFMARRELFEANRWFGWLISSVKAFPVTLGKFDSSAIREAINRLKQGQLLMVFPEGTRSFDGSIMELKSGLYLLAQRSSVPIIPTVINGAFEAWSRHDLLPIKFNEIRVRYGRPLNIKDFPSSQELTQRLQQELIALQKSLKT